VFWSNIYARIRLFPLRNKRVELWTKYNVMYLLVDNGFYGKLDPSLQHKHNITREMSDKHTKNEIAFLARCQGFKFKVYPFGDEILYRIGKTESK
jgi:hypothetical protein